MIGALLDSDQARSWTGIPLLAFMIDIYAPANRVKSSCRPDAVDFGDARAVGPPPANTPPLAAHTTPTPATLPSPWPWPSQQPGRPTSSLVRPLSRRDPSLAPTLSTATDTSTTADRSALPLHPFSQLELEPPEPALCPSPSFAWPTPATSTDDRSGPKRRPHASVLCPPRRRRAARGRAKALRQGGGRACDAREGPAAPSPSWRPKDRARRPAVAGPRCPARLERGASARPLTGAVVDVRWHGDAVGCVRGDDGDGCSSPGLHRPYTLYLPAERRRAADKPGDRCFHHRPRPTSERDPCAAAVVDRAAQVEHSDAPAAAVWRQAREDGRVHDADDTGARSRSDGRACQPEAVSGSRFRRRQGGAQPAADGALVHGPAGDHVDGCDGSWSFVQAFARRQHSKFARVALQDV